MANNIYLMRKIYFQLNIKSARKIYIILLFFNTSQCEYSFCVLRIRMVYKHCVLTEEKDAMFNIHYMERSWFRGMFPKKLFYSINICQSQ